MLCEQCQQNQATVHISQIINGVKEEKFLCPYCAKKEGFGFSSPVTFPDLFQSFFANPLSEYSQTSSQRCPECGMSFEELRQSGRLGCSHCYDVFRPQLNNTLQSIHGSIHHNGKLGKTAGAAQKHRRELETLREKLEKAIAAEEYEEAARLRDAIRDMEKGA